MLKSIMFIFMVCCWTCSHKSLSKELSVETDCECGPTPFSSGPLRYYCSQINTTEFSWKLTVSLILQSLPYLRLALISCPQVSILPVQAELCPESPREHLLTAKSLVPPAFLTPLCYQWPSRAAWVKEKKKSSSYRVDIAVRIFFK